MKRLFLLGVGVWMFNCSSWGQVKEENPAALIYLLTRPPLREPFCACGDHSDDRPIARSLVRLGYASVPAIENALNSIEQNGYYSPYLYNSGLLLLAYGQIAGPAACARLWRMSANPKLGFLAAGLDGAVALALNLTSYASSRRELTRYFRCTRGDEPRDGLDQFVLAWQRNDPAWLEGSLGPDGRAALRSLLKGRTWEEMRAEFWPGQAGRRAAVGFRFDVPGRWAEPDEPLDGREVGGPASNSVSPEIVTRFKDGAGRDCGVYPVRFARMSKRVEPGYLEYVVDNSELRGLFGVIAACAAAELP